MGEAQTQGYRRQIPVMIYDLPEFQALEPEVREAYFHIQINTYSTGLLVYKASPAALAADRRVPEGVQYRHMRLLRDAGMIDFDETRHVVYVPRALAYAKPSNPNILSSMLKVWVKIPPSRVKEAARLEILDLARGWGPRFAEVAEEALGRGAYVDRSDPSVPHPDDAYQPGLDLEQSSPGEHPVSATEDMRDEQEQDRQARAEQEAASAPREPGQRRVVPIGRGGSENGGEESSSAGQTAATGGGSGKKSGVRASLRDNRDPVVEGRRKGSPVLRGAAADRFERFWEVFAFKVDRRDCAEVWARIEDEEDGIDDELFAAIIKAAQAEADARPAKKAGGYRPIYPQGWISKRRWESFQEGGTEAAFTGGATEMKHSGEARAERNRQVAAGAAERIKSRGRSNSENIVEGEATVVEGM